jgi:hypothetical protein
MEDGRHGKMRIAQPRQQCTDPLQTQHVGTG